MYGDAATSSAAPAVSFGDHGDQRVREELEGPWRLLAHAASSEDPIVRRKQLQNVEDAGRIEDQVRNDYVGRYPIELLQNAHDACADAGVSGEVLFAVTDSALHIGNQGVPFTVDRVESLIRFGSSEKRKARAGRRTIGYKGVGFAAVFEVSDAPQVISSNVAFGFDRTRAKAEVARALGDRPTAVPGRGYPFPLSVQDWATDSSVVEGMLARGMTTVVRLPLRRGVSANQIELALRESLTPETLLFMPSVRSLEIAGSSDVETWKKRRVKDLGKGSLFALTGSHGRRSSWLLAEATVRPPREMVDALRDDAWQDVHSVQIAAGIPWRNGAPDASVGAQALHVYFPTDDRLSRAVLMHGDFAIESSRRHLRRSGPGGELNRFLAQRWATLVCALASSVADRGRPLLEVLASEEHASPQGFGETVEELLIEELRETRIVRSATGSRLERAYDLQRIGAGTARFDSNLAEMFTALADIVRPGDDIGPAAELLDELGVDELEWGEIAERLDPARSTLTYSEVVRCLTKLIDAAPETVDELSSRPVLKDAAGQWAEPRRMVIPQRSSPALPSRLRRVEVLPQSETERRLLKRLGVPKLTPAAALDAILDGVSGGYGKAPREAAEIHSFLLELWRSAPDVFAGAPRRLGSVPVPVSTASGRSKGWRRADATYFTSAWREDAAAAHLYGSLGEAEFLNVTPPMDQGDFRRAVEFYETLGIAFDPRVDSIVVELSEHSDGVQGLQYGAEWLELEEVDLARSCPRGHPQVTRRLRLRVLDRLDALLASSGAGRDRLAAYLLNSGNPYIGEATFECQHSSHGRRKPIQRCRGYQRWRLENEAWLPVVRDPTGARHAIPGRVWHSRGVPKWLSVPVLKSTPESTGLGRGLGLINADRPGVDPVVQALNELFESFPELNTAPEAISRSADWLLGRLERAARAAPLGEDLTGPVRFPAWLDRTRVWSAQPRIPDLPGLEALEGNETLGSEQKWTGLSSAFGLAPISSVLNVKPNPGDPIVTRFILNREKKAELAALLIAAGGQPERTTFRLARLQEHPVRSLTLSYESRHGSGTVEPTFHIEPRRSVADAIQGADLYWVPPLDKEQLVQLASYLDAYLALPGTFHPTIALYLTVGPAALASEHVHGEAILAAARLLERQRKRGGAAGDDDEAVDQSILDGFGHASEDPSSPPSRERSEEHFSENVVPTRGGDSSSDAGSDPSMPPPLDPAVSTVDVQPQRTEPPLTREPGDRSPRSSRTGRRKDRDWAGEEQRKREVGREGEARAHESERRRLAELGIDPSMAVWVSADDETSPYDMRSVEDDGKTIRYIEVKATTETSPTTPCEISLPEVEFGLDRSRTYYIYRVTGVFSENVRIWRYRDPLRDISAGFGDIAASQLRLVLPEHADDSSPDVAQAASRSPGPAAPTPSSSGRSC